MFCRSVPRSVRNRTQGFAAADDEGEEEGSRDTLEDDDDDDDDDGDDDDDDEAVVVRVPGVNRPAAKSAFTAVSSSMSRFDMGVLFGSTPQCRSRF